MANIRVLSAGAAKGLVADLRGAFRTETGDGIDGFFNAVGAIKEKFTAGEPCDVVILTGKLLQELDSQGLLLAGSTAPIGLVRTGVAVPAGHPVPDIATDAALRASMMAASRIYVPDPIRSTAGIHIVDVLKRLGIDGTVMPKLQAFPNGETAMRSLSEEAPTGALGCTQITEIKYTRGLTLVGELPGEYGLSTLYSVAVSATASDPEAASRLVAMLTSANSRERRTASGFVI
jgi:molybdate transport system substrate-binding protein